MTPHCCARRRLVSSRWGAPFNLLQSNLPRCRLAYWSGVVFIKSCVSPFPLGRAPSRKPPPLLGIYDTTYPSAWPAIDIFPPPLCHPDCDCGSCRGRTDFSSFWVLSWCNWGCPDSCGKTNLRIFTPDCEAVLKNLLRSSFSTYCRFLSYGWDTCISQLWNRCHYKWLRIQPIPTHSNFPSTHRFRCF